MRLSIKPTRLAALEKKFGTSLLTPKSDAKDRQGRYAPPFESLDHETRTAVDTETAAHHLNRKPQTLRGWACRDDGPLRPMRIKGRLAWPTAEIRRLLGVTQ